MTNPVYQFIIISIHALREEGDSLGGDVILNQRNFNPRPPRGERPWFFKQLVQAYDISIHALREESDNASLLIKLKTFSISIHALREESDGPALAHG